MSNNIDNISDYQKGNSLLTGDFLIFNGSNITCATAGVDGTTQQQKKIPSFIVEPISSVPVVPPPAYQIYGCTDKLAINYNSQANINDGSCFYRILGCTDPKALNYNPLANINDGSCYYPLISGCTSLSAVNYNPNAQVNDGSCVFAGCTDINALNYNPNATINDGSCLYPKVTACGCLSYTGTNLLFKLPCFGAVADNCACPFTDQQTGSFYTTSTAANLSFDVTFRVRGNAEPTSDYTNLGQIINPALPMLRLNPSGFFGPYNRYTLIVGNNIYLLNCGPDVISQVYDYQFTINIPNNSSYTLFADSSDGAERYQSLMVPDDDPKHPIKVTQPYPGQFMQLDIVNVTAVGAEFAICSGCGCTDINAFNYNLSATINDGSCEYYTSGCTDQDAINYDPLAGIDNGTCVFPMNCSNLYWFIQESNNITYAQGQVINGFLAGLPSSWSAPPNGYTGYMSLDIFCGINNRYLNLANWTTNNGLPVVHFPNINIKNLDIQLNPDYPLGSVYKYINNTQILGCTSSTKTLNFNPLATQDDGSCQEGLETFDPSENIIMDDAILSTPFAFFTLTDFSGNTYMEDFSVSTPFVFFPYNNYGNVSSQDAIITI